MTTPSKVLMRDDDGQPLAVTCKDCQRFCLDTVTYRCARCWLGADLARTVREQNDHIVTQAADKWLRRNWTR